MTDKATRTRSGARRFVRVFGGALAPAAKPRAGRGGDTSASTRLALFCLCALAALALCAAPAAAEQVRPFEEVFGSAEQPTFGEARGLAVYDSGPDAGDLLVLDRGRDEVQEVTVSATAGTFKLSLEVEGEAKTTADLPFDATALEVGRAFSVALGGNASSRTTSVLGGPGDAGGSQPYRVTFVETYGSRDLEPLACEDGAAPLAGGSGCSVVTATQGIDRSISRWHADGTPAPFSALGGNVIDGAEGADETPTGRFAFDRDSRENAQVAVDQSGGPADGDIYVSEEGTGQVSIFSAAGEYLGRLRKFGALPFLEVSGAGVGPSGTVYVVDTNYGRVYPFAPSANPVSDEDKEESFFNLGLGANPGAIALGAGPSAGSLFANATGGGDYEGEYAGLTKWDIAGREYLSSVLQPNGYSAPRLALAVDPVSGHLFVSSAPGLDQPWITEYDASGPSEASVVSVAKTTALRGLAVRGATDRLYVSNGARVDIYAPPATLPTLTAAAATEVTGAKATLNGSVDPEGLEVTSCRFEYVTGEQFEADGYAFASAETAPCEGSIPTDSSDHPVSAALSGLAPETSYVFRLAAENANGVNNSEDGTTSYGGKTGEASLEFTTPAQAVTEAASGVGGRKATLNAAVFPEGEAASQCFFEYGSTTAYGQSAPCEPEASEIPADEAEHKVSAALAHLTPNGATYHFRIAFEAGGGLTHGADRQLTTKATVITGAAKEIGYQAATLTGTANPEGLPYEACFFEYLTLAAYEANEAAEEDPFAGAQAAPCEEPDATEIGSGDAPVEVHARPEGLAPGTEYRFRLAATNVDGAARGAAKTFKTFDAPLIEAEWASAVTLTEATLHAEINPSGFASSYRVEWGPTPAYGHTTPPAALGASDTTAHAVSLYLEGLAPATTYHYRFLAENEAGEGEGEDRTFTTYAPTPPETSCPNQALRTGPAASLPDCRAYELVSPLEKNGGSAERGQASLDGDALAFTSKTSFAGSGGNNGTSHYLARRGGAGWSAEGLDPPLETSTTDSELTGVHNTFQAFSPDLSSVWFSNENAVPLTPEAVEGEENLYRRDNATGALETLTVVPPLESSLTGSYSPIGSLIAATGDLGQQFYEGNRRLLPEAARGGRLQIYDFSAGQTRLVSVLPDGSADPAASRSAQGRDDEVRRRVLSADGSRLFWISGGMSQDRVDPGTVYLRENPNQPESAHLHGTGLGSGDLEAGSTQVTGVTTESGAFQAGQEIVARGPTSGQELVPQGIPAGATITAVGEGILTLSEPATTNLTGARLDAAGGCTEAGKACTVRLSPGYASRFLAASPDGSRALLLTGESLSLVDVASGAATPLATGLPQEIATGVGNDGFLAASEDLSRVYFVSKDELAPGATPGAYNLYAWREGATALIATLPRSDFFPRARASHGSVASPDGRYLLFVSRASLTGYDTADAASGEADRELYRYDAAANGGEGWLACVSCNPSGARPQGEPTLDSGIIVNSQAARLPGGDANRRATSADGSRVFFEAHDALLPRDSNGTWDVYEWEAPGAGSCDASDPDYFARNGGCVYLISTGQSPAPSEFADARADGRDVFLRTRQSLDPRDTGAADIYDGRAGGGFPAPSEPPACEGDACQSVPAAPRPIAPASALFSGAGNLHAQTNCSAISRRAGKLSRRARTLHRHARRASSPKGAKLMRREAKRLAKRARTLGKRAKRCRRANRGTRR